MDEREAQDAVNDFGRAPVGISKEEIVSQLGCFLLELTPQEYNKETTRHLSQPDDDLPDHPSTPILISPPRAAKRAETQTDGAHGEGRAKGKKKAWRLEEVERWTMVKRIW